ncbi:MAG: hypothetical protein KDC98_19990 [Planctomycetes bacterium]|nr:hypothetical protein [Planctomycetota bacterium]
MPRNRRLRLLANLARGLGAAVALLALTTVVVWRQAPALVDDLQDGVRRALLEPAVTEHSLAQAETDSSRRRQRFVVLLERLAAVQSRDHHRDLVRDSHLQLSLLAEAAGDQVGAAEWMRRAVRFDDHDLPAMLRHAVLRCRIPEQQVHGMATLRQLAARYPGDERVVTAIVERLRHDGDTRGAEATLAAALRAQHPALWRASTADGARIELLPMRNGEALQLAVRLLSPCRELHVQPPTTTDDFAAVAVEGIDRGTASIEADGTRFTIRLPGELRFPLDLAVAANVRRSTPAWLRRLALRGSEARVEIDGVVTRLAWPDRPPDGGHYDFDFDISIPTGRTAAAVHLALPPHAGLRYRIENVESQGDDRHAALPLPAGTGPEFTVPLPAGGGVDRLRIQGVVR